MSDLKANIRNGNITGMSFGFYVIKDEWSTETVETSDGQSVEVEVRRILEVRLIEVSAVTFPAYEDTEAELASVASALVSRGDLAAIEKRARFRPELRDLLQLVGSDSSDRTSEVTPAEQNSAGQTALQQVEGEPGESTRETSTPQDAAADAEGTEPHGDHSGQPGRARTAHEGTGRTLRPAARRLVIHTHPEALATLVGASRMPGKDRHAGDSSTG